MLKLLGASSLTVVPGETKRIRTDSGVIVEISRRFRSEDDLGVIVYQENQQVEDPSPEPEQKEPLQGEDGEVPTADPGIGAPGPLPDAGLQKRNVVEGVGGEADEHLGEREVVFFEALRNAVDDLHFAYCSARTSNCSKGTLTLSNDTLRASLVWGDGRGFALRLSVSAAMPTPETEDDRPF